MAALVVVAAHLAYARQYFFLFDDFALVAVASGTSIRTIFSEPLFAFYRPAVFLLIKGETALFGWRHPAGFMAVSAALHFINAGLVFVILRRFALGVFAALSGAVLFAASPWSSEALFWLSGRFDVVSAFGTLVCTAAALSNRPTRAARAGMMLLALAGVLSAILSKENAVVAAPLALLSALAAGGGVRRIAAWWPCWTCVMAADAVYLIVRGRLLPGLGTAYGSAASLFGQSAIAANALGYVRAFVTAPLPWTEPGTEWGTPAVVLIVVAAASVTALAWLRHRRLVTVALVVFAAAILPTLWMQPGWFSTPASRFMYLPGMCGCLIAAAAIDVGARRGVVGWIASTGLTAATLAWALCSYGYQAVWWSQASTLARQAIDRFEPLTGGAVTKVFIPNLPFWFVGGPYVLKGDAFVIYFGDRPLPSVRTRNMTIQRTGDGARFAGWIDGAGLPERVPLRPAPDEAVVGLVPVIPDTPLAELSPARLSVFSTLDARRMSESTIALTTSIAWRAESSEPTVLTIVPARGRGAASLRLVPLRREEPVDRIADVIIRSDEPGGAVLGRAVVRVRVADVVPSGPPFGWLDAPAALDIPVASPGPLLFEGWALGSLSLRRVYGEAVGADGHRVPVGDARRDGERPDVSKAYPNAYDLYNARWILQVDPAAFRSLPLPVSIEVYAETSDGVKSRIGSRTIR